MDARTRTPNHQRTMSAKAIGKMEMNKMTLNIVTWNRALACDRRWFACSAVAIEKLDHGCALRGSNMILWIGTWKKPNMIRVFEKQLGCLRRGDSASFDLKIFKSDVRDTTFGAVSVQD